MSPSASPADPRVHADARAFGVIHCPSDDDSQCLDRCHARQNRCTAAKPDASVDSPATLQVHLGGRMARWQPATRSTLMASTRSGGRDEPSHARWMGDRCAQRQAAKTSNACTRPSSSRSLAIRLSSGTPADRRALCDSPCSHGPEYEKPCHRAVFTTRPRLRPRHERARWSLRTSNPRRASPVPWSLHDPPNARLHARLALRRRRPRRTGDRCSAC